MNTIKYKDWTGSFTFEPEDDCFHGQVLGIRDVVHFSGRSVDELKQALADSVEDYLEACASLGKPPEKPYSGKILVRASAEVHRLAEQAAVASGTSLNAFAAQALERAARNVLEHKRPSPSSDEGAPLS